MEGQTLKVASKCPACGIYNTSNVAFDFAGQTKHCAVECSCDDGGCEQLYIASFKLNVNCEVRVALTQGELDKIITEKGEEDGK